MVWALGLFSGGYAVLLTPVLVVVAVSDVFPDPGDFEN